MTHHLVWVAHSQRSRTQKRIVSNNATQKQSLSPHRAATDRAGHHRRRQESPPAPTSVVRAAAIGCYVLLRVASCCWWLLGHAAAAADAAAAAGGGDGLMAAAADGSSHRRIQPGPAAARATCGFCITVSCLTTPSLCPRIDLWEP